MVELFLLLSLQTLAVTTCPPDDIGCQSEQQSKARAKETALFDDRTAARTKWLGCLELAAREFSKQPDPARDVSVAAIAFCRADLETFYFADRAAWSDAGVEQPTLDQFSRAQEGEQIDSVMANVMAFRVERRSNSARPTR